MAQIMKKWIGDHQIDSTKIDPSYTYKMQGLNIPATGTFGIGVVNPPVPEISNPGVGAIRLQSTAVGGRTYELNSDTAGNFNIKDVNASANRFSITPSGVVGISNAIIGSTTFSTLSVSGTAFLHDASVSENLYVEGAVGVEYDNPLSTMAINGGLEIGSNTGIPGGLLVSDAPGGTEKFQVVLGNGGLTHVQASDTGAMSLEAGMASIEIGDFGSGTINLNGSTQILNTPGIPSLQVSGDTLVSENLFVGGVIGVNFDNPLSTMAINGGLEIGSNTGIPGGLLISDAPGGPEKFQVVLGNGGLTHVQASDTGAMSLEAGGATIEVGNFGVGTISLGGDTEIIGVLTTDTDTTVQGDLYVGADASVIGDIWMGSHLYTHSSLSIEPFTHLNLAPSTDLYLNPGSNLTTCYSDFTCVGEIKTNNLILGANAFQNTGVVINSGALAVNNGDINGGQNFYLSKTAYITDTTTGHLYDSGDASIIGDIWMGSHLYTHQSLTIEPNTDLNLAPSTDLYLNPGSGDTTSYGNITIAGAKAGIALTCTAGNIVTAYDMSCGGALRGNGLWMNGYVGYTTDVVISGVTLHFISGILTSIS
jgi:hypothetical protein